MRVDANRTRISSHHDEPVRRRRPLLRQVPARTRGGGDRLPGTGVRPRQPGARPRLRPPLAGAVREVIAVDPDAGMLAEGTRVAAGTPNIRWLSGDSTTLAALPPFDDVVMGGSFHWM